MKLIIFYSSRGARNSQVWDAKAISRNPFAIQYTTDGYAYVGDRLIETGVVDEVATFIESARHCGHIQISDKHKVYTVPYISCVEEFIQPGDVLFVRGGWKHWAPFFAKWSRDNWCMYYGAGTPRSHWAYWHAILYDFIDQPRVGKEHPVFPFTKPIHPRVFFPIKDMEKEYEILLNSCFHIYDKKGQYKFIEAAVAFKKLFGRDLSILLPGGAYRSTHTNTIPDVIKQNKLNVTMPGTVPREQLNMLINKCKLYVHLGYGEQNARSALEAMRCGLPLYIASPQLWPKFVSANSAVTKRCSNPNSAETVAREIHKMLEDIDTGLYGGSTEYFEKHNSPEITVTQLAHLINIMKVNKYPDQEILRKALM